MRTGKEVKFDVILSRRRRIPLVQVFMTLFATAIINAAHADSLRQFIDPSTGVSFDIPSGGWRAAASAGTFAAVLNNENGGRITINPGSSSSFVSARGRMEELAASQYSGASLRDIGESKIGGRDVMSAAFTSTKDTGTVKGAIFLIFSGGRSAEILCASREPVFIETFLACRNAMSSIKFSAPSRGPKGGWGKWPGLSRLKLPSPTLIDDLHLKTPGDPFLLIAEKNLFFALDGRTGCPETGAGPDILAALRSTTEGSNIDASLAAFMRATDFEKDGHIELAKQLYEELAGKKNGYFPKLYLARISLAQGDRSSAEKMFSDADGDSSLALALKIWSARIDGNVKKAKALGLAMARPFCGSSGALAAHQLGLAIENMEPEKAEELFRESITADPAYAPAYVSLGRLKLDRGGGTGAALRNMRLLLDRAPGTPDIIKLKKAIDLWESGKRAS